MELLLMAKPPDRLPAVMGPPPEGKPAEPPAMKILFILPKGTGPAEDDIGGAEGEFIEEHDAINVTINEAEQ
jgi:hypothetical protein